MKFEAVDQYLAAQPEEVREILERIRERMREWVPDGEEVISYQIPTIKVGGKAVVYFAAWKSHISIYPVHPLDEPLEAEVSRYRSGKDTLRFPLDEPIPYDLIGQVVAAILARHQGKTG